MSRIDVTYRITAPGNEIAALAHALALEQSVEVPAEVVRDRFVADQIVGQVGALRDLNDGSHEAVVRLATATTGFDAAQTINMLFGNSSLHQHVELVDAQFPPDFMARFSGPRFGIAGIRSRLGVTGRPLTCAALKPQGLSPDRLAALAHSFALAGIDIIKDDHGIADQAYSPFSERVAACQRAIARAGVETGRLSLYAPSVVGSPKAIARQAYIAREEGVDMVLVAPALIGMPAFAEFVDEHAGMAMLAHPAYGGAARVAPPLLLGKLFRLLGADATIFPNFGGRFAYSKQTCAALAGECRAPLGAMRPTLPVAAGGLSVARVAELVEFYGNDVMLLIGGSLLAAGDQLFARASEFVQVVARSATPATDAQATTLD